MPLDILPAARNEANPAAPAAEAAARDLPERSRWGFVTLGSPGRGPAETKPMASWGADLRRPCSPIKADLCVGTGWAEFDGRAGRRATSPNKASHRDEPTSDGVGDS